MSIVIPVYNEQLTVQKLIGLVVAAPLPEGVERQIICVNDASKDRTRDKLDELQALFPGVEFIIRHKD
ncbi:MAG TPA: glycosyltransferase, partial [Tepidisphaeraceae bacterium]|nr:glycosyltransferase [Tepidisphaeraceae bacterium]